MKPVTFLLFIVITAITIANGQQQPVKGKKSNPSSTVMERKGSDKPIPKVDLTKFKAPVRKDSIRKNKPIPKVDIRKFKPHPSKDSQWRG